MSVKPVRQMRDEFYPLYLYGVPMKAIIRIDISSPVHTAQMLAPLMHRMSMAIDAMIKDPTFYLTDARIDYNLNAPKPAAFARNWDKRIREEQV